MLRQTSIFIVLFLLISLNIVSCATSTVVKNDSVVANTTEAPTDDTDPQGAEVSDQLKALINELQRSFDKKGSVSDAQQEAEKKVKAYTQKYPNDSAAYALLGQIYLLDADYDRAISAFTHASALRHDLPGYPFLIARTYLLQRKNQLAAESFAEAARLLSKKSPNKTPALQKMAEVYFPIDPDAAIDAANQAEAAAISPLSLFNAKQFTAYLETSSENWNLLKKKISEIEELWNSTDDKEVKANDDFIIGDVYKGENEFIVTKVFQPDHLNFDKDFPAYWRVYWYAENNPGDFTLQGIFIIGKRIKQASEKPFVRLFDVKKNRAVELDSFDFGGAHGNIGKFAAYFPSSITDITPKMLIKFTKKLAASAAF